MRVPRWSSIVLSALAAAVCHADAPKILWSHKGHTAIVNAVVFSPDGQFLLSASDDRYVKVWRASDGAAVATLAVHYDGAFALAFSKDGGLLATGGTDRQIFVFRMPERTFLYSTGGGGFVRGLAFSPNARTLTAALGYSVDETAQFRTSDGEMTSIIKDHWGTVWAVDYASVGGYMSTAGADGKVFTYDATGRNIAQVFGHEGDVTALKYAPDGKLLASAGRYDRKLLLTSVPSGNIVRSLDVGNAFLHGVSFSPDGRYLAAAGQNYPSNGLVNFYRVADGVLLKSYKQGVGLNVSAVAFSPTGLGFAYGREDGIVVMARSPLPATIISLGLIR